MARSAFLIVTGFVAYVGVFRTRQCQRIVTDYFDRNPWAELVPGSTDSGYFFWMTRIAGYFAFAIACALLIGLVREALGLDPTRW